MVNGAFVTRQRRAARALSAGGAHPAGSVSVTASLDSDQYVAVFGASFSAGNVRIDACTGVLPHAAVPSSESQCSIGSYLCEDLG